ncbi:MAG: RNA pseudouridine synthase [Candidatus Ornithospirochaeta sp.]|nr:RNA pseudouridine synthase [Candidatus Ornithospirochaeta sp.]
MTTGETRLLFEGPDTVIYWKESGIPTVPLKSSSNRTLLDIASEDYPEVRSCHGMNEWEGGVIHRLDSLTKGIVLIARNQKAYDALMQQQKKDMIRKEYRAEVHEGRAIDEGFEPFSVSGCILEYPTVITSCFRSFGPGSKSVRPVLSNPRYNTGRMYSTEVVPESGSSVICTITRGFRHQIRAHLAWAGYPIIGDQQYGGIPSCSFGLEAISISYIEPCSGRKLTISV